jgi:uncharacterized protein (TIGR02147 family)
MCISLVHKEGRRRGGGPLQTANRILLDAKNSSEAARSLYESLKNSSAKYSLAFLSRKAKIPSRGYLSDIISGRRKANLKYGPALAKAFGLKKPQVDYFQCLLMRDHETDPEHIAALERRLAELAKVLNVGLSTLPGKVGQKYFAFEVFCVFGLFGNEATRADLLRYFGRARAKDLDQALALLVSWRLIHPQGVRYRLAKDFILFDGSEDGLSHIEFLKESVLMAHQRLSDWFDKPEQYLILSTMISVRRSAFEQTLPRIKELLHETQAQLETGEADMLVRFNVQIFPADRGAPKDQFRQVPD